MKLIAFIEGRCKPQPRSTQNVKFLFSNTVEYWQKVDESNAEKAALGMLNKKGNPFKPTRYAYRLQRLQAINEYRNRVFDTVNNACNGKIPSQNLFFFFLFHPPKNLSKKKANLLHWQPHLLRPDATNISRAIDDALYKEDSVLTSIGYYKMYVPREFPEGVLILQDQEIHQFVIDTAINDYILPLQKQQNT